MLITFCSCLDYVFLDEFVLLVELASDVSKNVQALIRQVEVDAGLPPGAVALDAEVSLQHAHTMSHVRTQYASYCYGGRFCTVH